jgi:hypothetical protein
MNVMFEPTWLTDEPGRSVVIRVCIALEYQLQATQHTHKARRS